MSDWIPMRDGPTARFPTDGEAVDIWSRFLDYRITDCKFDSAGVFKKLGTNNRYTLHNVSHWMPVPENPDVEESQ